MFIYLSYASGFRLNLTVLMTKSVPQMIVCVIECAKEPCCRSINYKKTLSSHNEPNCEMLHDVVNSTSQKFLERDSSYDHVHLLNPDKVYTIHLVKSVYVFSLIILSIINTQEVIKN